MRGEGFQLSFFLDLLYFFLLNDFLLASLFQSHDQKHTFDFPTYGYKVYTECWKYCYATTILSHV